MGLISRIQRYSTKDGPGLRSTVFLVGCNLRCLWCANPELMLPGKKALYDRSRCRRCGRCVAAAPPGMLSLGEEGLRLPRGPWERAEDCVDACLYDALELVGQEISPGELSGKLLRDQAFYDQSGGGVTFSGGEPALQGGFVAETARLLREAGCSVALDTAGCVPWENLAAILAYADTVLFDIKAFDPDIHRRCTGADNARILENAKKIAALGKRLFLRMVVVPGYNDQKDDLLRRLSFAAELGGAVEQVDLLKYHTLGQGKYARLGIPYPISAPPCDDGAIEALRAAGEAMGLRVTVGG